MANDTSEERIELCGKGHRDECTGKETLFGVTLNNMSVEILFNPQFRYTYFTMTREDLIMFRDAINKEIGDKDGKTE